MSAQQAHRRSTVWLTSIGAAFLLYALIGNYVALPGYLRFLGRGGVSEAGNANDLAVIWGATKTILWIYSFQLGVICFAFAAIQRKGMPKTLPAAILMLWLVIWSWPNWGAPGAWFYPVFGSAILVFMALSILGGDSASEDETHESLFRILALSFFAFATWDVCGLGSMGRILHPEEAAEPLAHSFVVTQSTKLMLELVLAWGFLFGSRGKPGQFWRTS